jgi:hypothetical protein
VPSRFFNMPASVRASINERLGAVSRLMSHPGADISETPGHFLGFIGSLAPPHRQNAAFDRPIPSLVCYSNAPVLNRWSRRSRRLSLVAMRPQQAQAVSGVGPAHELPRQRRAGHLNWIHILLAAAGMTFASSVAGVLVYNWYFDSVLVGLSSSLQPLSDAFHQLGASHITHVSPAPGN